jgi:hypothetical protein
MQKQFNSLFPLADLVAAREGHEREQAAEQQRKIVEMQAAHAQSEVKRVPAVREKKTFVYQARSPELWAARANQPTYHWERLHGHFVLSQQDRARLAAKAKILVEIVQSGEFPGSTVAELAEASGMSQSWVRKHLRQAGITLAKPPRRRR